MASSKRSVTVVFAALFLIGGALSQSKLLPDTSQQSNPTDSKPNHGKSETRTHSDLDIPTPPSLPETGSCVPYNGSVCYNLLKGHSIFVRSFETLEKIETEVSRKFLEITEKCRPFLRPLVCHYQFPSCDSSSSVPRPRQICYEECENLRTSTCAKEYLVSRKLTLQQVLYQKCLSWQTAEDKNCIKLDVNTTKTLESPESPKGPTPTNPETPTLEQGVVSRGKGKNKSNSLIPTWAVVIIVVVLLFALAPAVYIIVKKHFSHFTQVDPNVREDIGEEPSTERAGFIQENSPPSFDALAVLSRQLCNAEPLGAGATGENSSVRFQRGDLVIHNNYHGVTTVNVNTQLDTVNTNMDTTNNYHVELEQNAGMTVVGDNANINNYDQPPQN